MKFLARLHAEATAIWRIVRAYPSAILYPLLLLGLVLGVGIWGVTRVADAEEHSNKEEALGLAKSAALWFRQQVAAAVSPLPLMAALVEYNPHYPSVSRLFAGLAPAMLAQAPLNVTRMIEYLPNGVAQDAYQQANTTRSPPAGYDVFSGKEREMAIFVVQQKSLFVSDLVELSNGWQGLIARYAIFVANVSSDETFDIPVPLNPACGEPCAYNASSGTKFWGFAAAHVDLHALCYSWHAQLGKDQEGLQFEVLDVDQDGRDAVLMGSDHSGLASSDAVEVPFEMNGHKWVVRVGPSDSWRPAAYRDLLAGVVVAAAAIGLLTFAALVSWKRHQLLLEALLPKEVLRDLHGTDTALLGPRIVQAKTPADLMLALLGQLLEGSLPDVRDVLFIRTSIIRGADLYSPLDLTQHIRNANLDRDVARALMNQLGQSTSQALSFGSTNDNIFDVERCRNSSFHPVAMNSITTGLPSKSCASASLDASYATLSGALAHILTPHPAGWRDIGRDGGVDSLSGEATVALEGLPMPQSALTSSTSAAVNGTGILIRENDNGLNVRPSGASATVSLVHRAISFLKDASGATVLANHTVTNNSAFPSPVARTGSVNNTYESVCRVSMERMIAEPPAQYQMPSTQQQQQLQQQQHFAVTAGSPRSSKSARTPRRGSWLWQLPPGAPETPIRGSNQTIGGDPGDDNIGIGEVDIFEEKAAMARGTPINRLAAPTAPPTSTSGAEVQDDSALRTVRSVRRPPRKVASALGATGAAKDLRRRSLLQSISNAAGGLFGGAGPSSVSGINTFLTQAPPALANNNINHAGNAAASGGLGQSLTSLGAGGGGMASGAEGAGVGRCRRHSLTYHVDSSPPPLLATHETASGGGMVVSAVVPAAMWPAVAEVSSSRLQLPVMGFTRRHLAAGGSGKAGLLAAGGPGAASGGGVGGAAVVQPAVRPQSLPPPAPVIEEVERVLSQSDSWQFDTWRLRDVTNGHPLSALGFYLIQRAGLIGRLQLRPVVLARLLRNLEAGYNDNPYHNATHAADVLQTLHVILHGAQMQVHYIDHLGLLAAYFAAIIHDFGHPGLTNDFLVATSDPLAVRYNDRSPLENHHAAAAFALLQRPDLNLLANMTKTDRTSFRKQVIDMVLATDIKQHLALLSQFNTVHRLASFKHGGNAAASTSTQGHNGNSHQGDKAIGKISRGLSRPLSAGSQVQVELKEIVVDVAAPPAAAPKPQDDTERLLSLQLAIKAADLGHLGEALDVHKRWLSGLEEELFLQGDREKALGLPISPLFDRTKQGVSKSQVGFYDFVGLPLVHALSSAFPGTKPLMKCFLANYEFWRRAEGQSHHPANTTRPSNASTSAAQAPPAAAQPSLSPSAAGKGATLSEVD